MRNDQIAVSQPRSSPYKNLVRVAQRRSSSSLKELSNVSSSIHVSTVLALVRREEQRVDRHTTSVLPDVRLHLERWPVLLLLLLLRLMWRRRRLDVDSGRGKPGEMCRRVLERVPVGAHRLVGRWNGDGQQDEALGGLLAAPCSPPPPPSVSWSIR
uniref:Uncharacterized protein n=1 Tax=Anopheles merus TaxID=30066 RepID=A0A182UQX7_ANOME